MWCGSERGYGRAGNGNPFSRLLTRSPPILPYPCGGVLSLEQAGGPLGFKRGEVSPFPLQVGSVRGSHASSSLGRSDEIATSGRVEVTKHWGWLSPLLEQCMHTGRLRNAAWRAWCRSRARASVVLRGSPCMAAVFCRTNIWF